MTRVLIPADPGKAWGELCGGIPYFLMTPGAIGVAKQVLSELRSDDLRALARRVLRLPTVDEIEQELLAALGRYSIR